jgi:hypothetical protein
MKKPKGIVALELTRRLSLVFRLKQFILSHRKSCSSLLNLRNINYAII